MIVYCAQTAHRSETLDEVWQDQVLVIPHQKSGVAGSTVYLDNVQHMCKHGVCVTPRARLPSQLASLQLLSL
jgi:hypothetical protein